jgi:hypothetical protein
MFRIFTYPLEKRENRGFGVFFGSFAAEKHTKTL